MKKQRSVSLDKAVIDGIIKEARIKNKSVSSVINEVLEEHIEKVKKKAPER